MIHLERCSNIPTCFSLFLSLFRALDFLQELSGFGSRTRVVGGRLENQCTVNNHLRSSITASQA